MTWEESIANKESRETARKKFYEWAEMKSGVHDEVEVVHKQNDVVRLLVNTDDNHIARDLMKNYGRAGRNPIRVIGLDGAGRGSVSIRVLLANLTMKNNSEVKSARA